MMHIPPELLPVLQITVPLLTGLFIAGWFQSHALSLTNKRMDDVLTELRLIRARVNPAGRAHHPAGRAHPAVWAYAGVRAAIPS